MSAIQSIRSRSVSSRASPNTRALHLQVHDDLLLAVNCPSMWTMQISERAYFGGSAADILE